MDDLSRLFDGITGGVGAGRIERLINIANELNLSPDQFDIVECSDERTGRRFGNAACRRGYAYKLGNGGRNPGSRYAYQVWAVIKNEFRD